MAAPLGDVRRHDRRGALPRSTWESLSRRPARRAWKRGWGTVTGFQPPGSVDFHQTIPVSQLRAIVDVHIHYSLEQMDGRTQVTRWHVMDITMPILLCPLRRLILRSFDDEIVRTMRELKEYAEAHRDAAAA
jgi:hypothetical protein